MKGTIRLSITPQFINPQVINQQILNGRVGHFFRSSIPGFGLVTWQLIAFTPPAPGADLGSGTVSINIVNPDGSFQFTQVSNQDLVGIQYLGPTLPQQVQPQPQPPQPPFPPFPGGGGTPRPPWCAFTPWHPSCWRSTDYAFPSGYRGYVTYFVPVHYPI
ncbi:hypothetical protein ACFFSY_08110 [Paenibacillus aurantiacus]|uniref:Uncharacterized protein n=1 Tax=Paenibacillus aurantiacus TaxID=1936118 RepID=A0ABV5KLV2_9BACL